MSALLLAFQRWQSQRASRKTVILLEKASFWQGEARRCALLANDIDEMREPMRWARLQNQVNWARFYEREYREQYRKAEGEKK